MPRITLFKSSSTQLAVTFSVLIIFGGAVLGHEIYTHGYENAAIFNPYMQVFIALFLIVSIGLFTISHYVTKRINRIVSTADNVRRTGDLSARIPIDSQWDDLSKLSITLNSMLGDIELAVQSIRTVSDNIAHDLRTPLTRLRNRMDDIHTTPPETPEQCREEMRALMRECDAILATFQALLRISNIETGKRYTNTKEVALSTVLEDVTELYEPLAHHKNITFTAEISPCTVVGDKDLLFQLFANLCDNAVKYTPSGGSVTMRLEQGARAAKVIICDTGPGIPKEKETQVFQRFYRMDESRSTAGTGLGLSLVKAIVGMHQGSITLHEHKPHGLCVHITLPN